MSNRTLFSILLTIAVLSPFAISALADVIQPGVIGPSGGRANPVYRRFWTETPGTRGGTFGEPLYYEVDGGVVDAGVPVSDGGGFEPAAGASLRSPSAVITEDFCFTVEGSDLPDDVPGSSWQYGTGDDPVFWQIGEPGGVNSAYLAPTADGVLYLEVCDSEGEWSSYSTTTNTLTWADATVTACRSKTGAWKLYVTDANGQPVEQPTVTDGTGTGVWTQLGQDLIMGAGPGFGYRCTCGDGFIDCLEGCDDGATAANDGCSAACGIESGWACSGEPSVCAVYIPPNCGDNVRDAHEECDDGNNLDGDGCTSNCLIESNLKLDFAAQIYMILTIFGYPWIDSSTCVMIDVSYTAGGHDYTGWMIMRGGTIPSMSADGSVTLGTSADMQPCTAFDGIVPASFVTDTVYAPTSGFALYASLACGNGITAGAEQCDDGNLIDGDGCSSACVIE